MYYAVELANTKKTPPPKYMTIKKLTQHALLNIHNDLEEKNIYEKLDQSFMADVNKNYNIMHQEIYDTIEKHTLKKIVKSNRHKHKISKWITHGIIKSIKYRDKLYKKLKMTHHESPDFTILKVNLKSFNTLLKKPIRAAKYMYYESTFTKNKTNIRNTWKTINEIISKSPPKKQFPTFFRDGQKEITEISEIANKFNTLFTHIGPNQSKNINYTGDKTYKTYLKEPNKVSLKFEKVSETNDMQIINNLPNKNSCGFDGISTIVMKSIKNVILKPLTLIINQIINTGVFPNKLKIAKITPIFKKDDRTLFTNYRPISLLPIFSKVIEKVISIQINDFFVENKLFFNHQYGFRSGHSTEHAALELTDRIITALDNHNTPLNIFLDLSKAFDTLDHTILLDKLLYYGIRSTAYNLLRSYLANREQFVELNDTASKTLPIVTGVPQGSILGPLLFLIYINDFPLSSNFFKFIMYADDTTLYSQFDNARIANHVIELEINNELTNINDWLKINKLALNIKKYKYMISTKAYSEPKKLELKIDNINIEYVNFFNFLGLTIDSRLTWENHTINMSNKCLRIIGTLNRIKYFVPLNIRLMLYNTLILPHLNYCVTAWGYQCNRIIKLQKKAIRTVMISSYNAHTEPFFKNLKLLKIQDILTLQTLKIYHKFRNNNLPNYIQNWPLFQNSNIHNHNTRGANALHKNRCSHVFAQKSLRGFAKLKKFQKSKKKLDRAQPTHPPPYPIFFFFLKPISDMARTLKSQLLITYRQTTSHYAHTT